MHHFGSSACSIVPVEEVEAPVLHHEKGDRQVSQSKLLPPDESQPHLAEIRMSSGHIQAYAFITICNRRTEEKNVKSNDVPTSCLSLHDSREHVRAMQASENAGLDSSIYVVSFCIAIKGETGSLSFHWTVDLEGALQNTKALKFQCSGIEQELGTYYFTESQIQALPVSGLKEVDHFNIKKLL
ncbi:hypothetical protein AXG93_1052s1280 [Marchantia polymorpha subsp. ruderalis]|uniref:Uncharacterized protein n=1 Tax=Marchantia polymorpha subsp. ruderalis TaxID=1480154 RepID=A0A176VVY7_MARPO|nr:hypothetical protein AXG93_1052s1280 [Marchantia polymorpha subsp. ruderalis]